MDEGVRGSRTLLMKRKHEGDGWIGSKDKKAILHKNIEIRVIGKVWQMEGINLE